MKKGIYLNTKDILHIIYIRKGHGMKGHAKKNSSNTFCQLIYRPESGQKAISEIKIES